MIQEFLIDASEIELEKSYKKKPLCLIQVEVEVERKKVIKLLFNFE